jgi:putative phosphoesterase
MKILIMSDSHGWSKQVSEVVERHQSEVDAMFHCGDSELHPEAPELKGLVVVQGNCDMGFDFSEEKFESVQGVNVYVTHGHLYNVKMKMDPITYRGEEMKADIVCFGHSHIATSFQQNGVVYINPGSLRLPIRPKEQTYCICEVGDAEVIVRLYSRNGQELSELMKKFER